LVLLIASHPTQSYRVLNRLPMVSASSDSILFKKK